MGNFSDRTLQIVVLISVGKYLHTYKNSVIFYMLFKNIKARAKFHLQFYILQFLVLSTFDIWCRYNLSENRSLLLTP